MESRWQPTALDRRAEASVRDFYNLYSKEDSHIKQAEVTFLFLEKNVLSNRLALDDLARAYHAAAPAETDMTFPVFLRLFQTVATRAFPGHPNPVAALIAACANEKARFRNWKEEFRIYFLDDLLKRTLQPRVVAVLAAFGGDLRRVFTLYNATNYAAGRVFLTWEELRAHNKRMRLAHMVVLLEDSGVLPALMHIEAVCDACSRTIVNQDERLTHFYQEKRLKKALGRATGGEVERLKIEGDPKIGFHEFQLLLCRLAAEAMKCTLDSKGDLAEPLERFLRLHLGLRTDAEVMDGGQVAAMRSKLTEKVESFASRMDSLGVECGVRGSRRDGKALTSLPDSGSTPTDPLEKLEGKDGLETDWVLAKVKPFFPFKYLAELERQATRARKQSVGTEGQDGVTSGVLSDTVQVLGVTPPVPRGAGTVRKAPPKPQPKENVPKDAEKPVGPPPTPSVMVPLTFYIQKNAPDTRKPQVSREVDTLTLFPEPLYITLYPLHLTDPHQTQLLECVAESAKALDFALALQAWDQLRAMSATPGHIDPDTDTALFFLRGMVLERLGKTHLALESFYECLTLTNE